MKEELSEKELQELEKLYGHNREENLQSYTEKNAKENFYKWGTTFFKTASILMLVAVALWLLERIMKVMGIIIN